MHYRAKRSGKESFNKITIFIVASGLVAALLIVRLFQLQVLSHGYYQDLATRGQYGYIELPAQRGEVIIQDYHSNEEFLLATNTTLNLLYADPTLIKNPLYIGDLIAPMLFNLEEEREKDKERIKKIEKNLPPETSEEERKTMLAPRSDSDLEKEFREEMIRKISETRRQQILLTTEINDVNSQKLAGLKVPGIEIDGQKVYAYPAKITNPGLIAETISPYVEIPSQKLSVILKGENRYTILKRRLSPEATEALKKLFTQDKGKKDDEKQFAGLGFQEEYFRFYPEGSLGANVVGYVAHDNIGQYGIESSFNTELQGKAGKFQTKRDSIGRQITVGESILEPAVDGDDIVLTIDRSIQLQVERLLEESVKYNEADSGQIIVLQPKTGAILAMAHYPSFDPNTYGDAFRKVEIRLTPEEAKQLFPTKNEGVYSMYKNEITLEKYTIFEEKDEHGRSHYYRYENFVGPEVYHNKIISWPYEPGSVFKSIAMAIAIDDGDVTPHTTYNDTGPVGVDWNRFKNKYDFYIKNSTGYFGLINMQTVLAKSLNTGMTFVAKKMGPALFYSYLKKFGFLDRTDIEFDSEAVGKIEHFDDWTESELATHAFGQGMTITMLQLANAYAVIANGGLLMQPHIVKEIRHDDDTKTLIEPRQIRRVISEDTAAKMTAMLTYSVEQGEARQGQVDGHFIAGKTGTSQTYKHGRALSGKGTTIATFAGFAPINDPQFVILTKLDYPRRSEWGSSTAAPTTAKIAEYILNYYNIPPDKTK